MTTKKIKEGDGITERATKEKPSAKELTDFHTHDDVDGSQKAHHHTLGSGHNQASPGDHSHDGSSSAKIVPLENFTITGARGGNTAVASIIDALELLGATDGTTP